MKDESQTVHCRECGVPILQRTALRTNGLCMPCSGGYREAIDAGARHARETREYERNDPFRQLWLSLVERVCNSPSGFEGLSDDEKLYFAVGLLDLEVFNGGFEQYFFNSSGSYYVYVERGLIALAATRTLPLLQSAKEVLFPGTAVPQDTSIRRSAIRNVSPNSSAQLDELDKKYCADPDKIASRLQNFARKHGFVADSPRQGSE